MQKIPILCDVQLDSFAAHVNLSPERILFYARTFYEKDNIQHLTVERLGEIIESYIVAKTDTVTVYNAPIPAKMFSVKVRPELLGDLLVTIKVLNLEIPNE